MSATNAGVLLPFVAAVAGGVDTLRGRAETDSSNGGTFLGSVVSQALTAIAVLLGQNSEFQEFYFAYSPLLCLMRKTI